MLVTCKEILESDSLVESLVFQGIPTIQLNHEYEVADVKVFKVGLGISLKQIPQKLYTGTYPEGIHVYWKLDRFEYKAEELAEFLIAN